MNHVLRTGSERIIVLERLRQSEIIFPPDWDEKRATQKSSTQKPIFAATCYTKATVVIMWLLQHDPKRRPSALELSQSKLLPARVEDEYFKEAVRMMSQSKHL